MKLPKWKDRKWFRVKDPLKELQEENERTKIYPGYIGSPSVEELDKLTWKAINHAAAPMDSVINAIVKAIKELDSKL